jgi:DNA-directed RNA polymerase subunit RPC12/RpoP
MAALSPLLVSQWHPTKNGDLLPTDVTAGSRKKVFWLDENCGHDWEAIILNRSKGYGCPYCAGRAVWAGFNDLATTHPVLARQWHPTLNGDLTPYNVSAGSTRMVHWIDEFNHVWKSTVANRKNGNGCPVCSNKQILAGFNDFATTHSEIAAELHPTKNGSLDSSTIFAGSQKRLWWLCPDKSHVYDMNLNERTSNNQNCPYCSHTRVLAGETDLETTHPVVAAEWHSSKNGKILPSQVFAGSNKRFWWKCPKAGHEWQAAVSGRTNSRSPSGCPQCWGRVTIVGETDLPTTYPEIARYWHPTKNGDLKVEQVSAGSNKRVWWLVSCNHEWEDTVNHITARGLNCPYCSNRRILIGFNDFATTHPIIARQLHLTKNGDVKATDFTAGHDKGLWWVCDKNSEHEWEAAPYTRKAGHGCPVCWSEVIVSKAEHELYDFLTKLGFVVEQSNRKVLGNGQEIDLYIPALKFGIEFNGLYWHSDAKGKDKNYHQAKYLTAQKVGIELIQVWEDDWRDKKDLVVRLLGHKLGKTAKLPTLYPHLANETERVFARKTQVATVTEKQVKQFLIHNSLEGYAKGTHRFGLTDENGGLRAVLVVQQEADGVKILRYATYGHVIGGFTKLLKNMQSELKPKQITAEADLCYSSGSLYKLAGFTHENISEPSYMWLAKNKRISDDKMKASVKRHRIWDAGQISFCYGIRK